MIPYFSVKQISEQVTFRRDELLRVSFQPISVDKPEPEPEEEVEDDFLYKLKEKAEQNYSEYLNNSFELDAEEERIYKKYEIEEEALAWYNDFTKDLDELFQDTFGQTDIDLDQSEWIQEEFQSYIEEMKSYEYFVEKSDELWMSDYQDSDGNTYWKRVS